MKICKICKTNKTLEEYGKSKKHKDGLNPKCKVCEREYRREQRERRGDTQRAKQAEWYQENRERILKEKIGRAHV